MEEQGTGTPIVLLHGGPGSTHLGFHPSFDRASKFARVIYYDQRGCGLSDYKPEEGYTVNQAASDLNRLRESLGIEKWVVLGHSYGGFLAQYYATLYPAHVRGLVIVCGGTGLHDKKLRGSRQWDFIAEEEQKAMRRFGDKISKKAKEEDWPYEKIVESYSGQEMENIGESWLLFKLGLALYDLKNYEKALFVFGQIHELDESPDANALIWHGHMLDLLGRRDEAVAIYRQVVRMNIRDANSTTTFDTFGLKYIPSIYAEERIKSAFKRIENLYED